MSIRKTIEDEVGRLKQRQVDIDAEDTDLARRIREYETQIARAREHRASLAAERSGIRDELDAAQRALAVLVEHQPATSPSPSPVPSGVKEEAPAKAPTGRQRRRGVTKRRHTQDKKGGHSRNDESGRKSVVDPTRDVPPVRSEELDIIRTVVQDYGPVSQLKITDAVVEVLDLKRSTAVGLTSVCLTHLLRSNEIRWTGEHEGRSKIFRVATPTERASAGLPVGDEPGAEFEGTTTHPPHDARTAAVPVPGGAYEQGKR